MALPPGYQRGTTASETKAPEEKRFDLQMGALEAVEPVLESVADRLNELQQRLETFERQMVEHIDQVAQWSATVPRIQIKSITHHSPENALEDTFISTRFQPRAVLLGRASRTNGTINTNGVGLDWQPVEGGFIVRDFQGFQSDTEYDLVFVIIGDG